MPSQFQGICSYPHGGWVSAALLLASWAAFGTTVYAVMSCQFVQVTFDTPAAASSLENVMHCWEGHLAPSGSTLINTAAGDAQCQASIGLFQWLRPFDVTSSDSNDGTCVGYQESMLAVLQSGDSSMFDVSRAMGVLGVVVGLIVSVWGLLTSCIAWNWLQLCILRALFLVGAISSGLALLLLRANVCTDDNDDDTADFPNAACSMSRGALMLIASVILWLAAFFLSIMFVSAFSSQDLVLYSTGAAAGHAHLVAAQRNKQSMSAQKASAIKAAQKYKQSQMRATTRQAAAAQASSPPSTPRTLPRSPRPNDSTDWGPSDSDDDDSINSFQNRQRGVRFLQRQQQKQKASSQRKTKNGTSKRSSKPTAVTVDDVTARNELEVYISEKMARIDRVMDDNLYEV